MILRHATTASLALMAALCSVASAQTPPVTILTIEMENVVQYDENFANPQKNGTSTAMEVTSAGATFFPSTYISDIVAINVETGEYELGPGPLEAQTAFSKRWAGQVCYLVRGDGGPINKFHGK